MPARVHRVRAQREFNLIALSFWLCIGDVGSVLGSNMISHVRDAVCANPSHWICTSG